MKFIMIRVKSGWVIQNTQTMTIIAQCPSDAKALVLLNKLNK